MNVVHICCYFSNKGSSSQGYVVKYGYESLSIKKDEHRRTDAFELWCWRRFLRVPWIARRSIQSILKEISPGISLEGVMLKLKLQYFGHLMRRVGSLEKTLMLGGIDGRRRRDDRGWDGWMASLTRWTRVWVNSGCWWWTGRLVCCDSWGRKELNTNWTELNWWPSNPTAGHAHRGNQNGKRHVYSYVHRSTVYNSQYTEAT